MLLSELYQIVGNRTGLSSSDSTQKTILLDAANGQLKRLYTNLSLEAEKENDSLITVDGTYLYRLNARALRALNFRETDSPAKLFHKSRADFERDYPNPASTEEGVPQWYIPMRKVRVSTQPTSASTISISSASASDITSYYVVVRGIVSGSMVAERLLLTGATVVVSANSYTSLLSITKDTTNGTVTATSNAAVVTNISLLAGETEKEMWEVRLHPIPDAAYTIPYTYQYIPWKLSNDEDVIALADIYSEAYLAMVVAQVLFEIGDPKFQVARAEANQLLGEVQDNDYLGNDDDFRFGFPEVSVNNIDFS